MDIQDDGCGAFNAVQGSPTLLAHGPTRESAAAALYYELLSYQGQAHLLERDDESNTPATERDIVTALKAIAAAAEEHGLDLTAGRRTLKALETMEHAQIAGNHEAEYAACLRAAAGNSLGTVTRAP